MFVIVVAVLVVLFVSAAILVGIYNRLVMLRNRVDNALSQIDVQLQRRYDLIPNLVEVAKKFMAHERETLEAVIAARNEAHSIASAVKESGNIAALAGAEQVLGASMMKLHAVAEAYPELKADVQMSELTEELATTENRVAYARQAFNDSVTEYNTAQQLFPAVMFASGFGHRARDEWVVRDEAAKDGVKVNFDT
jgi:LemA protein